MRIEKGGYAISSLEEWALLAPPKSPEQWVDGRSAKECAKAWFTGPIAAMPAELRALLDSREETKGLAVDVVMPEHRITFDENGGEPRNADVAFVGQAPGGRVAVTVEAKADEPFAATVSDTLTAALERLVENPRSRGAKRVEELVRSLLPVRRNDQPDVGALRYQLLTAVAGTLAYAADVEARVAVLVVHEFFTRKTVDKDHARNAADYAAFLHRLTGRRPSDEDMRSLVGPITVPGLPLFKDGSTLFVGKAVADRRTSGA